MQIDRTNYETWFLDYIDGNLSVDLIDDFLEFLNKNPDLKEELQSVSRAPVRLPDEKIMFIGKKDLLKNELTGSSDFDYLAIACMERDLTEKEKIRFEKELQGDPRKLEDFNLIKKLRLQPQTEITFPDKEKLLKSDRRRSLILWPGRIAAILVLGFLIWILSPSEQKEIAPQKKAPVASLKKQPSEDRQNPVISKPEEKPQLPVVRGKVTGAVGSSKSPLLAQVDHNNKNQKQETRISPIKDEPMTMLQPLETSLIPLQTPKIRKLQPNNHEIQEEVEYTKLTDYLAQKILDVPKGEPVTLASLAKAGLQIAENVSNNKLSIETGHGGKIAEINFNSRLFGFSIPVKKNK